MGTASAVAPAAPTGMRATAISFDFLALSWVDNATDETGFELEYKIGSGGFAVYPSTLGIDARRFFAGYTGTAGLTITMRVRAYNLTGVGGAKLTSAYSTSAAVVMPAATVTFLPPSNISATSTASSFTGTWTNNATNKTGFLVLGRLSSAGTNEFLANVTNPPATITEVWSPFQGQYVPVEPATSYNFIVHASVTVPNASGSTDTWYSDPSVATTIVTKDTITSKTGTSSTPGAAFSHSFTNSTASAVTSRTLTPVPSTLTFNSSTGALTGTYPPLGIYTLLYTVNFANGWSQTQTFYIRVRPAAGAPVMGATIPAWTTTAGSTRDTPVAGTFTDAEAESAVRVSTTLGDMDFILFDTATPATVANFKNYLARYSDVVFHRSIAGFVIQGGGYRSTGIGSNFNTVLDDFAVANEPGIANARGTVSMAKLGGNPDSATNEFFVSLGDNRSNLDYQNGGFTVFGRVAGNGMNVADAISLLPTRTYSLFLDGGGTGNSFGNFPMNAAAAPVVMDQSLVVKMISVTTIPTMTYIIASNTDPAVVSASIVSGQCS
jgi:cyclophilin family peptidyl-prolyl cis-trans isomerase